MTELHSRWKRHSRFCGADNNTVPFTVSAISSTDCPGGRRLRVKRSRSLLLRREDRGYIFEVDPRNANNPATSRTAFTGRSKCLSASRAGKATLSNPRAAASLSVPGPTFRALWYREGGRVVQCRVRYVCTSKGVARLPKEGFKRSKTMDIQPGFIIFNVASPAQP